ncbi:hypothetical protein ACA910_006771 [Epithemia clementina (nom. ined.)]
MTAAAAAASAAHSSSNATVTVRRMAGGTTSPPKFLTKSLFLKACECPRKLKYALRPHIYPHQLAAEEAAGSFGQFAKEEGRKVALYSRLLFPQGILIGQQPNKEEKQYGNFYDDNEHLHGKTLSDLARETRSRLMQVGNPNDGHEEEVVLFEGVVPSGPFLIQADILRRVPLGNHKYELHVLEVKAKTWDTSMTGAEAANDEHLVEREMLGKTQKSIQSTYLPYILDVAFQKWVLQRAFVKNATGSPLRNLGGDDDEAKHPDHHHHQYDFDVNENENWFNSFERIQAWLVLPDRAKINTTIPNLNARLFAPQVQSSRSDNSSPRIELHPKIRQLVLEKGELLVQPVNVDRVVDRVLQNIEPFSFPGSNKTNASTLSIKNDEEFEFAIHQWADYVTALNTNHHIEKDTPSESAGEIAGIVPPPIGSHCRKCEFRFHTTPSSKEEEKRGKEDSGHSPCSQSGFDECWKDHTMREDVVSDEIDRNATQPLRRRRAVADIWNTSKKQVQTWIDQQKYFMEDLNMDDFGLGSNGNDISSTTTTTKGKKSGMTRSHRQWYQVFIPPSYDCRNNSPSYIDSDDKNNNSHDNGLGHWRGGLGGTVVLDREYLRNAVMQWKYPWHFVDFETIRPALPYSTGKRPYDMLAFQFSHHVIEKPNGPVQHMTEFLHAEPGQDPNPSFLNALAKALLVDEMGGDSVRDENMLGTVFRWGAHENTVLSELLNDAAATPTSTVQALEMLLSDQSWPMVDLQQVTTKAYYVAGSDGSASLKKLLLPTLQASPLLQSLYAQPTYTSQNFNQMQWVQPRQHGHNEQNAMQRLVPLHDPYDLLQQMGNDNDDGQPNNQVSDGTSAMRAYDQLQRLGCNSLDHRFIEEVRSRLERSLLRYCELDTLAMAMIVQAWQGFLFQGE